MLKKRAAQFAEFFNLKTMASFSVKVSIPNLTLLTTMYLAKAVLTL